MTYNRKIYIYVIFIILTMVQIQFDIDEHEDKNLRIYMAYNNIKSKSEAIRCILSEYFLLRPPKFKPEDVRKTIENQKPEDILK